jgi:hypothetical protein
MAQDQERGGQQRKSNKEIAAERRENYGEKFKMYQDRANKKLYEKKSSRKFILNFDNENNIVFALDDKKVIRLRTNPLNQIRDNLKRVSEEFNFDYRGIDGTMRQYLGKGKHDRDANMTSSTFKKLEK